MKLKGRRIRSSDKTLLFSFIACRSAVVFCIVLICFQWNHLKLVDWEHISILDMSGIKALASPYLLLSIIVSVIVTGCFWLLYWLFLKKSIKQVIHRQLLARMILDNKWYVAEQKQNDSFFKDLPSAKMKEKISEFPKMYYRFKNNMITITVGITMGKYQEQLLELESKLESGLFCECIMKELKESWIEYTLLYNLIENRITIDEVKAEDGKLQLMKNVWWKFDSKPHMLISGSTKGGKTYYLLTLIECLLQIDSVMYIFDPKQGDLADLAEVLPNVYFRKEDMISCLEHFYEAMMERQSSMKKMPNYKTGKNYAYLGLPANFLIFDEYVAFIEMLSMKEREYVLGLLKKIVMLGRQSGYFLILACQRPDAKYLGDGIRDQFNFRVALGRNSELGYGMMFGDADKKFYLKDIDGRGYLDGGKGVITEFYTPLVPEGHDFLEVIGSIARRKGLSNYSGSMDEETELLEEQIVE